MTLRKLLLLMFAGTLFFACGEIEDIETAVDTVEEEEESPLEHADEEACEHIVDGPFEAITAWAAMEVTAPAIAADHHGYQVEVTGETGYVKFEADESADFVFYADTVTSLAFFALDGTPVEIENSVDTIDACTEVKARHIVEFEVGTYFLAISGPVDITFVVEELGGHDEDDHDDEDDH